MTLRQVTDVLLRQRGGPFPQAAAGDAAFDSPAPSRGKAIVEAVGPPSLQKDLLDLEKVNCFFGGRLAGYEAARAKILAKWGQSSPSEDTSGVEANSGPSAARSDRPDGAAG